MRGTASDSFVRSALRIDAATKVSWLATVRRTETPER